MKYAIVILLAACLLCTFVQAIELPLKYERYPEYRSDESLEFWPYGASYVEFEENIPEGEWKLPKHNSKFPLYGWIEIGDQKRLIILDKRNPKAKFYDRIYFDVNANSDLTDDKVIEALKDDIGEGPRFYLYFPRMDIPTLVDGVSLPYYFFIDVNYNGYEERGTSSWWGTITGFFKRKPKQEKPLDLERLRFRIYNQCMYTAELEQEGTTYKICLADYNGNGRFDDLGKKVVVEERDSEEPVWVRGDAFYLAPKDEKMDYRELQFLGQYLHLKNTLYTVNISQAEKHLTLTPVTEGVAKIELPVPVYRIVLMNDDGWVMSCMPEKTVLVLPGTYQLLNYVLFRDEPTGARWQLCASASGVSPLVTVAAGESASYVIGEPFRPFVTVPEWSRTRLASSKSVDLVMYVMGAGKELIQDLDCIKDRGNSSVPLSWKEEQRPREPTFKILKPDGEVVNQGAFEYG